MTWNRTSLEVVNMVVSCWIVAFLRSDTYRLKAAMW